MNKIMLFLTKTKLTGLLQKILTSLLQLKKLTIILIFSLVIFILYISNFNPILFGGVFIIKGIVSYISYK